jgi:hypothetical protein
VSISKDEKLDTYVLDMHQLINAMSHVQFLIRRAKSGKINLMDPEILERLDRLTTGESIENAIDAINSYVIRKVNNDG